MIDPISAFAAVNTAASAISTAIKAGKDLSSLSGPISRYAQAEAQLNFGASKKEKGIFAKMTGAEQAGIDEFFRKEELATLRDEMRSVFQLYGKPGAWERLQAEIARQRAIQKEELERRAKVRETILLVLVGFLIVGVGGGGIILWIAWMKGMI